jgi:hypothetical protein
MKTADYWNDLDPREQERLRKDWMRVVKAEVAEWEENAPELLGDFMRDVLKGPAAKPALRDLLPEELIKALSTEQVVKSLPTEEVVKALPTEEVIEAVPTEKLLNALSPEKLDALKKLIAEREKANKPDAN